MDCAEKYCACTICTTFNHEPFIKDAMSGFTMQETSYPFVCIIIDDASTDGTAAVIDGFLDEHFDFSDGSVAERKEQDFGRVVFAGHRDNKNCFFVVIFLKENHNSRGKSKIPYYEEWMRSSRYIAFCEGDDYWTNPLKLQMQVNVLERHEEMSLCCSACTVSTKDHSYLQQRYLVDCIVPPEDIIAGGGLWLHLATYMVRRDVFLSLPLFCRRCHVGDYPLILWASMNGNVFFLSTETAVYRFQSPGSWTQRQNSQSIERLIRGWRSEVNMLENMNGWSKQKYESAFHHRIADYLYDQMLIHKEDIKRIIPSFKSEIRYFSLKQKAHLFFTRIHMEAVYSFLLDSWHIVKKRLEYVRRH